MGGEDHSSFRAGEEGTYAHSSRLEFTPGLSCLQEKRGPGPEWFWGPSRELVSLHCLVSASSSSTSCELGQVWARGGEEGTGGWGSLE